MTSERLNAEAFAEMGVVRPMTKRDIEETCRPALLDKTLPPELPPAPEPRCHFCFGPVPCEHHANVEYTKGVTTLDLDPTEVLVGAHNAGLKEVVIVGMRHDGTEYFASSIADGGTSMYHLQRDIYKLNKVIDGEYEDENVGPPAA